MAFDSAVVFFLTLALVIGVPAVILIALYKLGTFVQKTNKFINEHEKQELENSKKQE
ncbi:MAG: hypothetical protein JRN52_03880 [Nitrososphaerota archaeon]|nr:hypothetical protein [Nitrososphaerota archaeon]